MGDTGISWTDETWNPVRGCSRVSEGCRHCYAEQQAARIVRMGKGKPTPYDGLVKLVGGEPRWTGKVVLDPAKLAEPLRWRSPRRIFVNSMSDLFHESLTNEQIAAVFGVMAACPQHTFQILTKRARRMREWFEWADKHGDGQDLMRFGPSALLTCAWEASTGDVWGDDDDGRQNPKLLDLPNAATYGTSWPLPNVWIGVSIENRDALHRLDDLRAIPAAVRMVSAEPLLEDLGTVDLTGLGWWITGCESGPDARPCDVAWLRSLRDQCTAAGVPYFLKQAHSGPGIGMVPGSRRKPGGIYELPALDDVQHAAFPEPRP